MQFFFIGMKIGLDVPLETEMFPILTPFLFYLICHAKFSICPVWLKHAFSFKFYHCVVKFDKLKFKMISKVHWSITQIPASGFETCFILVAYLFYCSFYNHTDWVATLWVSYKTLF